MERRGGNILFWKMWHYKRLNVKQVTAFLTWTAFLWSVCWAWRLFILVFVKVPTFHHCMTTDAALTSFILGFCDAFFSFSQRTSASDSTLYPFSYCWFKRNGSRERTYWKKKKSSSGGFFCFVDYMYWVKYENQVCKCPTPMKKIIAQ